VTDVRVEKRVVGGTFTQIGTTNGAANGINDLQVATGTSYEYRVRACNQAGCSAYSSLAWITHQYPDTYGILSVVVSGLPSGTSAAVTIGRTDGFAASTTTSTNFSVGAATYAVIAQNVTAGALTCTPTQASQGVIVSYNTTVTATVAYTCH
jgi:hypothetical protein